MNRKRKSRAFPLVVRGASTADALTLVQLQQGPAAGAVTRLLVELARQQERAQVVPDAA
ncbi:MAG: hypothetical protein H0X24_10060 [Ktedonobacterales bacterium]|nr:hypothetical protein [Ktedonobacterales bacterium]